MLSIRRFPRAFTFEQLVRMGTVDPDTADLLRALVRARMSIVVSGGTSSGKTTLLNALSGFIPAEERIVTIEDSAELQLQQPHVISLEARPPNVEGKGQVTIRDLVRNSLRMRPDRIVVGEVRGPETHRHAPGDEHRPRRLADHRPRQLDRGLGRAHADAGLDERGRRPLRRAARPDQLRRST